MSGDGESDRSSTWPSGSAPGVVVGDLLEQTDMEALVNPWNRNFVPRHLLLVGGVSGQLKKVTGPEPWKELARHGLLPVGGVVGFGREIWKHLCVSSGRTRT